MAYVPPSRRGSCSKCGKFMHLGKTSLPPDERTCIECRRAKAPKHPPLPPTCMKCGAEKSAKRYWYCDECRVRAAKRTKVAAMRERGYGTDHQRARAEYVARFTPGDPCARCSEPMWDAADTHLDHNDERTGYLGLSHATCNIVAGGLSRMQRTRPIIRKDCVECGSRFSTSYPAQVACSIECRHQVNAKRKAGRRRAARLAKVKQVVIELKPCPACGVLHSGRGKFCGEVCARRDLRVKARNAYRERVGIPLDAPLIKTGRPRVA